LLVVAEGAEVKAEAVEAEAVVREVTELPRVLRLHQERLSRLLLVVGVMEVQVLLALVVIILCLAPLLLQPVVLEELAPPDLQAVLEVAAAAVEAYEQGALVQ
jgi:hypothetical protein